MQRVASRHLAEKKMQAIKLGGPVAHNGMYKPRKNWPKLDKSGLSCNLAAMCCHAYMTNFFLVCADCVF